MFFLNLTAVEFFALLGTLGGLITALYLLDRSRRKRVVSTLRFWASAQPSEQRQKRKSVQEPWSLFLQLLSLLLLLLALAQLEWGKRETNIRNHVLLLDVSSSTGRRAGGVALLEREKSLGEEYLNRLGPRERVMLVRVDDLATPVTPFTTDRTRVKGALAASVPSYSALDLDRALSYARQAQGWSEGAPGEIVYIGPKRVRELPASKPLPAGLRVIAVDAAKENCGISGIVLTRGDTANTWHATIRLRNYGTLPRTLRLLVNFSATNFTPRRLILRPGQETAAEYDFVTKQAGQLAARIDPPDNLVSDDHAAVAVPENKETRVVVFTRRPDAWRPLFGSNAYLEVRYLEPSHYDPQPGADLMVVDQFGPLSQPKIPSLWVDPPRSAAPVAVKTSLTDQVVARWNSDGQLGAGLRAKDVRIARTNVFVLSDKDFAVASVGAGPVAVVRPAAENQPKLAIAGFDLLSGQWRFEVSGPLLFANLVRWLSPEAFRTLELGADPVGLVNLPLERTETVERMTVADEKGKAVPFTTRENRMQFYVDAPAVVRITSDQRERIVSLVLPEIAEYEWKPTQDVASGLPNAFLARAAAIGLWKELAGLGALLLVIEWILYGRRRRFRPAQTMKPAPRPARRPEPRRELISK
jgi:Aerotolerance regulator N-terminal/von Willebrand factor type A domain